MELFSVRSHKKGSNRNQNNFGGLGVGGVGGLGGWGVGGLGGWGVGGLGGWGVGGLGGWGVQLRCPFGSKIDVFTGE